MRRHGGIRASNKPGVGGRSFYHNTSALQLTVVVANPARKFVRYPVIIHHTIDDLLLLLPQHGIVVHVQQQAGARADDDRVSQMASNHEQSREHELIRRSCIHILAYESQQHPVVGICEVRGPHKMRCVKFRRG